MYQLPSHLDLAPLHISLLPPALAYAFGISIADADEAPGRSKSGYEATKGCSDLGPSSQHWGGDKGGSGGGALACASDHHHAAHTWPQQQQQPQQQQPQQQHSAGAVTASAKAHAPGQPSSSAQKGCGVAGQQEPCGSQGGAPSSSQQGPTSGHPAQHPPLFGGGQQGGGGPSLSAGSFAQQTLQMGSMQTTTSSGGGSLMPPLGAFGFNPAAATLAGLALQAQTSQAAAAALALSGSFGSLLAGGMSMGGAGSLFGGNGASDLGCGQQADGCDELAEDTQTRAVKRPRLVWTPQLHECFVKAVNKLGVDKAVPKTIMRMMNVDGLTRENVASHLQKYRLQQQRRRDHAGSRSTATDSQRHKSPGGRASMSGVSGADAEMGGDEGEVEGEEEGMEEEEEALQPAEQQAPAAQAGAAAGAPPG